MKLPHTVVRGVGETMRKWWTLVIRRVVMRQDLAREALRGQAISPITRGETADVVAAGVAMAWGLPSSLAWTPVHGGPVAVWVRAVVWVEAASMAPSAGCSPPSMQSSSPGELYVLHPGLGDE